MKRETDTVETIYSYPYIIIHIWKSLRPETDLQGAMLRMHMTFSHNKYCENVQDLMFVVILNISMVFLKVIFISV